ncbi:MAG: hypothetical protein GSR78_04705 [Desulfurococcales archaeon]|nr:hypothetical protein [Desulfurococcales archaeon]
MPRTPVHSNQIRAAGRLIGQPTLLLFLTVLATIGTIAGLAQAAQQDPGTQNTTVVTVEFRLGDSNDTVVDRVECGNLTVITILTGDNTTSNGRIVFSLKIEGAHDNATSILNRAYDCVSGRRDMTIARLILDAVINATETTARSKPQHATEAQSQVESLTIQAEDSNTQVSQKEAMIGAQQDPGSPYQPAAAGENAGTIASQAGTAEAPDSAGVQGAAASTGEPGITGLIAPLAAGTLLGLLFYYLARIS